MLLPSKIKKSLWYDSNTEVIYAIAYVEPSTL